MPLRFRLLRFPVELHPSFLITALLLGAGRLRVPELLASWIAVVLFSVLLHELGHAVAFRLFKRDSTITLLGMGGLTRDVSGKALPPWQDVVVSLAGPAFGLVAAAVVYAVIRLRPPPPEAVFARTVLVDLFWANGVWGLVNLLPILPLDGGRVLYSTLRLKWKEKADLPAYAISFVVALAASVYAFQLGNIWCLFLGATFAFSNGMALFHFVDLREVASVGEAVDLAEKALAAGDVASAKSAAELALGRARRRARKDVAYALLCIAKLRAGDAEGARATVRELRAFAVSDEILLRLEQEFTAAGLTKEAEETARLRTTRKAEAEKPA